MEKFETIREAAENWVSGFNAVPTSIVYKLIELDEDDVLEITPPSNGDRVYIWDNELSTKYGEIIKKKYIDEDDLYVIKLDNDEEVVLSSDDFEVKRDGFLPMWGTMWTFGDSIDEEWANGEYLGSHLQEMANCGFRVYEQEDFGLLFGIDGAGYDFYEEHWIPLYKSRGLHWHKEKRGGNDHG